MSDGSDPNNHKASDKSDSGEDIQINDESGSHSIEVLDNSDDDIDNLEDQEHLYTQYDSALGTQDGHSGGEEEEHEKVSHDEEGDEQGEDDEEEQDDYEGDYEEDQDDDHESQDREESHPEDGEEEDPSLGEQEEEEEEEEGYVDIPNEAPATHGLAMIQNFNQDQENAIPSIAVNNDVPMDEDLDIDREEAEEQHDKVEELANSSGLQLHNSTFNQFTTPSKSLPPLKDIDLIETPKSFSVARDEPNETSNVQSSPLVNNIVPQIADANTSQADISHPNISIIDNDQQSHNVSLVSSFLNLPENEVLSFNQELFDLLVKKAVEFSDLHSNLSFFKLNQEKSSQIAESKLKSLNTKLKSYINQLEELKREKGDLTDKLQNGENLIQSNRGEINSLNAKINELENTVKELEVAQNTQSYDSEIIQFNNQINQLTKENIDKNYRISELSKELNDVKNELFTIKFDLTKASNEASHFKREKIWFETEWKTCQDKFTELSKTYNSERVLKNNEVSELSAKVSSLSSVNENLNKMVKNLNSKIESQFTQISQLDQNLELSKIKLEKEVKNKDNVIEILNIQISENKERIQDLEEYIEDIKVKSSNSVEQLSAEVKTKTEKCIELEERLRRTEDALEENLRAEGELPKLTQSAELIAANSEGISLSTLYSEFNHLKKQLIVERSQKEKLANDLQTFVSELESKKPVILSYKEQIAFYETSMKDMVSQIESVRFDKLESDKKNSRLKAKIAEYEDELVSMKKLSKDLGKQLCYYLINSKIHDSNDNPLTLAERKAIENILEKSGNNEAQNETNIDQVISERLVGFVNVIELQKRNAELLTLTRELGKKLEDQDNDDRYALESVAIEEAKDAILTLEGELDSLRVKFDAVTKERDVLKVLTKNDSQEAITSSNGQVVSTDVKYLSDINQDLKGRIDEYESSIKGLQTDFSQKISGLNTKINELTNERDELKLKVNTLSHEVNLAESRYNNSKLTLENSQTETTRLQESISFWKEQASKQENLLISRTNELKDVESKLSKQTVEYTSIKNEKELLSSTQKSLSEDIDQLRKDKLQLNEFVLNLQSLLKERESSNAEMSNRLNQSISNYQTLQDKLSERDDRLSLLSNQTEMALKAQNTKLEQVNELSYELMTAKQKLSEKTSLVETLNNRIKELTESLAKSDVHVRALQLNGSTSPANANVSSGVDSHDLAQAKHELQLAELQVKEFESIAKNAEDALVNLTSSFDDYKKENDSIQESLRNERSDLTAEVEKLTKEISALQNEISSKDSKHSEELSNLKLKYEEAKIKAENYDRLEKEYDNRINILKGEIDVYSKLADENQTKYNEESAKHDQTQREVSSLRDINVSLNDTILSLENDLENVKSKLSVAESDLNKLKQRLEEEITSQKLKAKDIESQNNILLNQLELLKSSSVSGDASDSLDELRQVINFLRRAKETSEAKVVSLTEDAQKLQLRLDSTVAELETARSELLTSKSLTGALADSNQEREKLMKQLEQINILNESNTTLRKENQDYTKQVQKLEVQIKLIEKKIEPLNGQIKQLNEKADEREQRIKLLQEENGRLTSSVGNNADVSNEKLKDVQEKFEALQGRYDRLLNESQTKLRSAKTKEQNYQAAVSKALTDLEEFKKRHEQEISKLTNSKNKDVDTEKIKKDLEASAKTDIEKFKRQFQSEKDKLISDYESKLKNLGDVQQVENKWKTKYAELEKSIEEVKKQLADEYQKKLEEALKKQSPTDEAKVRETVSKEFQGKIDDLQKQFSDQLTKEKTEVQEKTRKQFELKMKILNKKVDRLEASANNDPEAKNLTPTESTLTVHQPESQDGSGSGSGTGFGFGGNDKKRPQEEENGPNKKPKE